MDRKLLLRLFLPYYTIHCLEQMYFLLGPVVELQGISPQSTGWILGAFFIGVICSRPAGGWALEYLGVRLTLALASLFGLLGGVLVALFISSIPLLLAGRFLTGFGYGAFVVAMLAYQTLAVPYEMRGGVFALITTGGMLPMATIVLLAEWFLRSGFTAAYLWMGPVLALICLCLAWQVGVDNKEISVHEEERWGSYRDLIGIPSFVLLGMTSFLMALIDGVIICIANFTAEYGLTVSCFFTCSAVSGIALRVFGSRYADRIARDLAVMPSILLMAAAVFGITFFPSNGALLIGGVVFGMGIGMGYPVLLALISDLLGKKLHPKGTVAIVLTFDAGWIMAPLAVGYLSSMMGGAWAFRSLAFFSLACAVILYAVGWLPRHKRQKCNGNGIIR